MKALIITMTCGEGHNMIAKSLASAFDEMNIENKTVQIFGYSEKRVKLENKQFLALNKYFPHSYNLIWNVLRKKTRKSKRLPYYAKPCYKYILNNIQEYSPDIIICTHHYASAAISYMKHNNILDNKVITATIAFDYCLAPYWEHSNEVDYIFQPHTNTTEALLEKNYRREQIQTFGLPIREDFEKLRGESSAEFRKKLNLPQKFTVMNIGGGNGLGNTLKLLKSIVRKNLDINIIIVNGKNKKNYNKIAAYCKKNNIKNVINLAFINNVAEYMSASDVILSRCGGCGVSEIFALDKPFIIREKLIINEKINKRYFIEEKMALGMNKITDAGDQVEQLIKDPELYQTLKQNILKVSYPNAAKNIVQFLVSKKQTN